MQHRQLRARAQRRAADQPLGPHLGSAVGRRLHERSSIGYVTAAAYPDYARHARTLAEYEGFSSHYNAVSEVRDRYLPAGGRGA